MNTKPSHAKRATIANPDKALVLPTKPTKKNLVEKNNRYSIPVKERKFLSSKFVQRRKGQGGGQTRV
jgi:hypothetical protein